MWNRIHLRQQNRRNVISFQDGFGESSLFSIQIGQFYIIPIFSSTSRDHFGSKKNPPVWIYFLYIYVTIYTCYIMYTWYWYAWKIQQWCSILYIISSCFKREGRQIVTFSKLGSSVLFKQNSSQVPVPKPGGKPHTSYMFKHCKFPRGHTLLSQGGNNGNNGGQTVELVELGWFGDGWEEDVV